MEEAHSWNGGRHQNKEGYWLVFVPGHHLANHAGYVPEHRLVWETATGETLERKDFVHHIDGNRSNNNPSNLQKMTAQEHAAIHRDASNGRMCSVT